MRIFLTFSLSTNNSVKGNIIWYRNLYEPLIDLGHDIYFLNIDNVIEELKIRRGSKYFKERYSQILLDTFLKEHREKPFNLFFSYLMNTDVDPQCINEIKKNNVLTANFSCNNSHQFNLVDQISSYFDYSLHSEKDTAVKFIKIGAKPKHFQMAANPKYYHPIILKKKYDASFIGANYAKRAYYINHLLNNSIDIHIFGPGWCYSKKYLFLRKLKAEIQRSEKLLKAIFTHSIEKRTRISSSIAFNDFIANMTLRFPSNFNLPISDQEMIRIYNESKCVLGFLEVYDEHDYTKKSIQYLHLREFEVPMCKALYFTNYTDELTEYYEPDREVIVFQNELELFDKIKYYLSNPQAANIVREAGYKRALNCHTYQKRFKNLFREINLA